MLWDLVEGERPWWGECRWWVREGFKEEGAFKLGMVEGRA